MFARIPDAKIWNSFDQRRLKIDYMEDLGQNLQIFNLLSQLGKEENTWPLEST